MSLQLLSPITPNHAFVLLELLLLDLIDLFSIPYRRWYFQALSMKSESTGNDGFNIIHNHLFFGNDA